MATAYQTPAFPPSLSAPGPVAPSSAIPTGTFLPGTKVQVGEHRVVIERYLSEGGFAHVYVVRLPKPIDGKETAVLKRVAVPDKDTLATLRTEVETMKKLKGRRYIVTYIDSHASPLKGGGGYEVFLLMEYCNGGGLIDFMNTRLQNRLTEPEVLKIFSDVSQGVACMHYLKPPLLHRDLKVENVLIGRTSTSSIYKLCDFGSTSPPRPAATNAAEGRLLEEDVQKHTTLQYRSPEMVDVYRKQPMDEKSDIWALGVLLYKLCYYKTPFEEQGQMAILNASFKYPSYPPFSDRLKKLIAMMLQERPQQRPNIYQVVREVAKIRGTDVPIRDVSSLIPLTSPATNVPWIYGERTQSESRRNQQLPTPEAHVSTPPVVGAVCAPPPPEKKTIPDITPMRRGRPTKVGGDVKLAKPSPSPLRPTESDPFTVLDSGGPAAADQSLVDVSSRFPALDDFSILHEKDNRFSFDPKTEALKPPRKDIDQRVTNALADDAFAALASATHSTSAPVNVQPQSRGSRPTSRPGSSTVVQARPSPRPPSNERSPPERPAMISTGTNTSPPRSPSLKPQPFANRSIWRLPEAASQRSHSQPRRSDTDQSSLTAVRSEAALRQALIEHRSQTKTTPTETANNNRRSLEPGHRSLFLGGANDGIHRSKSATSKSRPSSMQSSKPSILRRLSRDRPHADGISQETALLDTVATRGIEDGEEAVKINSDVEYLKALEEEDSSKRKEKRIGSGTKHIKRGSLPSVSLSGTKNMLAGRFAEAFRKFETNNGPDRDMSNSPLQDPNHLTPIAGSEATDGCSDDGKMEDVEDVSPEFRRELERRRLSEEERRIADATAAHKKRLTDGDNARPSTKAASIQTKVKSLLDESGRASPSPTKTASGYGKYTDVPQPHSQTSSSSTLPPRTSSRPTPSSNLPNRPMPEISAKPELPPTKPPLFVPPPLTNTNSAPAASETADPSLQIRQQRPTGPPKTLPKPQTLRTGDRPSQPAKPASLASRKSLPQPAQQTVPPASVDGPPDDDWETNFSKRYPDLSGLEMVETEIDQGAASLNKTSSLRKGVVGVRDV